MTEVDTALQTNLEEFRRRLGGLLKSSPGQYAIFAGGDLVKVLATYEAALTYGYEHYSDEQHYLLQKIAPIPEQLDFHVACRGS
ncbi:hypothetical protein HLB44_35605 [Aquincola sp. S2]|uniref:DUF5678 domain-containing protein n=1 Tax=Pseudaquabacterium terrae TaxID=2732868 RepID=A0ABX2EUJ0_9BURK|nr:hypothetical protein [Aquabacterium terrae]NRF72318.1 hypothetical protein [Aquabacterium terrae]